VILYDVNFLHIWLKKITYTVLYSHFQEKSVVDELNTALVFSCFLN